MSNFMFLIIKNRTNDALHKTFDFRTDYELITKATIRTLIKDTKQIKSEILICKFSIDEKRKYPLSHLLCSRCV